MSARHSPADLEAAAEAAAESGYAALRLERVGRTYGSGPTAVQALKDVDLEVWPGEFVVLLGPSGSGKTTLLNLVGGIEEPTGGRILMAGNDIGTLSAKERTAYRRDRVGFVFQFFNLVPTLTALENVEIIAELAGQDSARRSREALEKVGLSDVANRFPGQLSGGQQQRVAIARGYHRPALAGASASWNALYRRCGGCRYGGE
jgi:putative ABC transport system ATP-binding protein